MRETLDVSVRVLKRLAGPHTIRSWSVIAKRERLTDDQVTRALARAAELVGGDLTEVRDNRLVPTALGHEFYKAVEPVLHLGQEETIEVLTVAVTPAVDPALVARAVIAFSKEWGRLVGFKLAVFAAGVREAVESEQSAFGIVDGSEGTETDEPLNATVPLVALIPYGHRLAGAGGPLDADHFSPSDRVFFPSRMAEPLSPLLTRVPAVNRIAVECPQTLRVLVETGGGIGFEYARLDRGDTFARVPVLGVPPLALGLVLPRKRERLTAPAHYFLGVLRQEPDATFFSGSPLDLPAVPELPPIPEPELLPIPEPIAS